jgi:hypothetical protein
MSAKDDLMKVHELIHRNGEVEEITEDHLQAIEALDSVKSKCLDVLEPKKRKWVNAFIANQDNVAAASRLIGISERTGYRWLEDPIIRHAVNLRRSELQGAFTITPEMVAGNLARVAFEQNPTKYGMRWADMIRANEVLAAMLGFDKSKSDDKPAPPINFGVAIFPSSDPEQTKVEIINVEKSE